MLRAAGLITMTVFSVGCGDNSKFCGQGTDDRDGDGECEAFAPDKICGDGTSADPITSACIPDPETCGGGTVLVNGRCQDPTAALDIDLEEGPEPNAFEPGAIPAGVITLEPVGADGVVIHGCVTPIDGPDLDVYQLTVDAPTLLSITADGVQGLAAGFQLTSTAVPLATWRRFGIDLATDMSRRQVLLPTAGTYRLVVTDSRTLFPALTGGPLVPAGNADGTSCYFVTVDQLPLVPVPFVATTGASGMLDDQLAVFSTTLAGSTSLTATFATPHAQEAIVVLKNGALHAFDDDGSIVVTGVTAADALVVVMDFVHNYALFSVPYTLTSP
jgi:hypothetical protein